MVVSPAFRLSCLPTVLMLGKEDKEEKKTEGRTEGKRWTS